MISASDIDGKASSLCVLDWRATPALIRGKVIEVFFVGNDPMKFG